MNRNQLFIQYSALSLGIILSENSDAQVLYTDIDPDIWWQWDNNDIELILDVDHDGLMDFRIFTFSSSTEYYSCSGFAGAFFISAYRSNLVGNTLLPVPTPSELNCICVAMCDSFYNLTMGVRPALPGDTISIDDNWGTAKLIYAEDACGVGDYYGLFTKTDDHDYYIPIEVNDHGTHLGWIRLNHKASVATKIIFDMAIETQAEKPIVVGDTSDYLSIFQPMHTISFTLAPNPTTDIIHIQCSSPISHPDIKIFNSTGQLVLERHIPQTANQFTISGIELPAGSYFLRVVTEGGVEMGKFEVVR